MLTEFGLNYRNEWAAAAKTAKSLNNSVPGDLPLTELSFEKYMFAYAGPQLDISTERPTDRVARESSALLSNIPGEIVPAAARIIVANTSGAKLLTLDAILRRGVGFDVGPDDRYSPNLPHAVVTRLLETDFDRPDLNMYAILYAQSIGMAKVKNKYDGLIGEYQNGYETLLAHLGVNLNGQGMRLGRTEVIPESPMSGSFRRSFRSSLVEKVMKDRGYTSSTTPIWQVRLDGLETILHAVEENMTLLSSRAFELGHQSQQRFIILRDFTRSISGTEIDRVVDYIETYFQDQSKVQRMAHLANPQ